MDWGGAPLKEPSGVNKLPSVKLWSTWINYTLRMSCDGCICYERLNKEGLLMWRHTKAEQIQTGGKCIFVCDKGPCWCLFSIRPSGVADLCGLFWFHTVALKGWNVLLLLLKWAWPAEAPGCCSFTVCEKEPLLRAEHLLLLLLSSLWAKLLLSLDFLLFLTLVGQSCPLLSELFHSPSSGIKMHWWLFFSDG